jgi:hypothetical protein
MLPEFPEGRKSRIENLIFKSMLFKKSREAKNAERNIGSHDLLLLGIFRQEIAVGEKDFQWMSVE